MMSRWWAFTPWCFSSFPTRLSRLPIATSFLVCRCGVFQGSDALLQFVYLNDSRLSGHCLHQFCRLLWGNGAFDDSTQDRAALVAELAFESAELHGSIDHRRPRMYVWGC